MRVRACVYVPYRRPNGWADQGQTWYADSSWPE